jgi:hypothetical protein
MADQQAEQITQNIAKNENHRKQTNGPQNCAHDLAA